MVQPIRVLHVVTYMGRGGLETMIMNYYRHMDRTKVQFDFLTHRDFRADYDDEIEELGGKIYHLPRLVPWSRSYQNKLDSFLELHPEYKIIHVHQDCLSSIALRVAKNRGIPIRIAHSHSNSQDKNVKYLIKLFYRHQIPRYATQLFACGKEAGDWMFNGAPYRIINNAINTKCYSFCENRRIQMRKVLGIKENVFVVGHVGRFDAVKNHTFLLDVFAAFHERNPDSCLLLVGDGVLRPEIEQKADRLGILEYVIFTGIRSDVPDVMQAMDCFVFPSLYEGLPLTLIEAQAAGLTCFVSDAVPAECDKTGLIERLSLRNKAKVWGDRILQYDTSSRPNTCNNLVRCGYDITVNAQWLQNYYLDQWKKEV